MKLSVYYVDAFTDKLFSGNPAAVIFSDLTDTLTMQNIAAENNLSETAFIREEGGIYHIRWFAPSCEIDLCGHATLASAYVYFNFINPGSTELEVHSIKNGSLKVLAIVNSETMVRNLEIDFELLKKINVRGLIVSARGDHYDFVSRCFFPGTGVNEDPVTGSAHTTLTPYWSKKLNKKDLSAMQLSERGGVLSCEDKGERIIIGGKAVLYMKGKIYI